MRLFTLKGDHETPWRVIRRQFPLAYFEILTDLKDANGSLAHKGMYA